MSINRNQWEQIDAFIRDGQLIQAIKIYREGTGADLAEAKEAVEARAQQLRSGGTQSSPVFAAQSAGGPSFEQWKQIDEMLAAGRTIEAIKLYRGYTGVGLKEAKDAVDARTADLQQRSPFKGASQKKGCLGALLLSLGSLLGM